MAKHRRVPLSEKPQERPRCPLHPSHVAEFTCLLDSCRQPSPPLMCFVCKDYGTHKNHKVLKIIQCLLKYLYNMHVIIISACFSRNRSRKYTIKSKKCWTIDAKFNGRNK